MASPKTVTGKVTGPDNSVRPQARVGIAVSVPAVVAGQQEIPVGPVSITASAVDGTWSTTLYSNSDLSPAGTTYTVVETTDISQSLYTITVPAGAGPFACSSIVTSTPLVVPPSGNVSTLTVTGATVFTNGPVTFPDGGTWTASGLYARFTRQTIAYASTITPDASVGSVITVGNLTGNLTVAAPTNPAAGQFLTFIFTQDSTGGRTVSWNAVFRVNWQPSTAASARNTVTFEYDGTSWNQIAASVGL